MFFLQNPQCNNSMPANKGNLFVLFQKTRLDVLTIIYVAVSNKLLYTEE